MRLDELCSFALPAGLDLPCEVFVRSGATAETAGVVERHVGQRIVVVADPETWRAADAGGRLALPPEVSWRLFLLHEHDHADAATVERIVEKVGDVDGLLAVGSGTVNDVTKLAATERQVPYAVVGTAASMNGYASGVAALFDGGGKITVPARSPRAILLDTDVLAAAPPEMARAGFGDLISKPLSDADWWLDSQLHGGHYDELPGRIVDAAVADVVGHAAALGAGDAAAHEALGRALVLSGVAMVVAGSSSPASGGEHLLSHLWDMEALAHGRPLRLHGAQVGIASCLTAALYERLVDLEQPAVPPVPPWSEELRRIEREHGVLASFVTEQAERKHARASERAARLRAEWPALRSALAARRLPPAAELRQRLERAGAVRRLVDIGLTPDAAIRALCSARDIRDRYTVLDLAFELGVLPGAAADVLAGAGV